MANEITLDSAFLREYAKRLKQAEQALGEARADLQRANRQTGWSCPERHEIFGQLSDLSRKTAQAAASISAIAVALEGGAGQFDAWEGKAKQYEAQMSGKLRKKWSFVGKVYAAETRPRMSPGLNSLGNPNAPQPVASRTESVNLPVQPVPAVPISSPVQVGGRQNSVMNPALSGGPPVLTLPPILDGWGAVWEWIKRGMTA